MEILGWLILAAIIYAYGPAILTIVLIVAIIFIMIRYINIKKQRELQEEQRLLNEQRQKRLFERQKLYKQRQRKLEEEQRIINELRNELLNDILCELHLENINLLSDEFDDHITVKSLQSLENYSDFKYLRDTGSLERVREILEERIKVISTLNSFLKENHYKYRLQYDYVEEQLVNYVNKKNSFRVKVVYITPAGNNRGEKVLHITEPRVKEVTKHPELLMTRGEYTKFLKQQAKEKLDRKKHSYYARVNDLIDTANNAKEVMVIKSAIKTLDELVQDLTNKTANNIQKVKDIDSDDWKKLDSLITEKENEIDKIVQDDKQVGDYYASEDFALIKETCKLLIESQKEFNEYIEEKAESITKLFGKRAVRKETQTQYTYNYIRPYKKSVSPFTAELSKQVYGSAENDHIGYVVKYFYPNKSQYKEQIQNLRILIEELETLNEAKDIIDNYKRDYARYIQNVPEYVMERDKDGFYSRLGLTIIDEAVLNFEYRFEYTSDGGKVQKFFTVPMNEGNITALIHQLDNKLSMDSLTKEQRALMTSKLRTQIKERDNYTCCICGNSVYAEPNLLLEVDHIIPISKGGLTEKDNLQTLCWKCNRSKGAKMISEEVYCE